MYTSCYFVAGARGELGAVGVELDAMDAAHASEEHPYLPCGVVDDDLGIDGVVYAGVLAAGDDADVLEPTRC